MYAPAKFQGEHWFSFKEVNHNFIYIFQKYSELSCLQSKQEIIYIYKTTVNNICIHHIQPPCLQGESNGATAEICDSTSTIALKAFNIHRQQQILVNKFSFTTLLFQFFLYCKQNFLVELKNIKISSWIDTRSTL